MKFAETWLEYLCCGAIDDSPWDGIERIGFNLNANRSDCVTAVGVERIQVKTCWTKALGEAVTFIGEMFVR